MSCGLCVMSQSGADAGFRVRGGASGVSRISARGVLKVRPHTKSGGRGAFRFRSDTKSGGGGASGPIYEKWAGGAIPLQVRYLWAHRKYLHVPTHMLPRYTSHARANERKIHAGKG